MEAVTKQLPISDSLMKTRRWPSHSSFELATVWQKKIKPNPLAPSIWSPSGTWIAPARSSMTALMTCATGRERSQLRWLESFLHPWVLTASEEGLSGFHSVNHLKPLAAAAAYNLTIGRSRCLQPLKQLAMNQQPHGTQSCLRVQNKVISHFNCCKLRGRDCRTEPLSDVFRTIQIHGKPLEAPAKKGLHHTLYCTGCPSHRR